MYVHVCMVVYTCEIYIIGKHALQAQGKTQSRGRHNLAENRFDSTVNESVPESMQNSPGTTIKDIAKHALQAVCN